MTVNQLTVHPSTAVIPSPRFNLGELVSWNNSEVLPHALKGVITEQVYRIDHKGSSWQYTMAITSVRVNGRLVDWYADEFDFDVEENALIHIE